MAYNFLPAIDYLNTNHQRMV